MLREDIKGFQKATSVDLRKFGLTVGGTFVLLALFFLWRHKPWYWYLLVPGAPLVVLGATFPRSLKWIYVGWMTMAIIIGAVVSTILLTFMFFLVITPIGWLARATGKDFLALRRTEGTASYWIRRDVSMPKRKQAHERQF